MNSNSGESLRVLLNGYSISGAIHQFLVSALREFSGASPVEPSEDAPTDADLDPDRRISLLKGYRLWRQIEDRAHRSDVGMAVARLMTPEKAGLIGYLFMESHTLRDAVEIVVRHMNLSIDNIDIRFEERDNDAVFYFTIHPQLLLPYSMTECYLFSCFHWWSMFAGREQLPIKEASFVYAVPRHVDIYRRMAPCAVLRFNQKSNVIRLDREVFDTVNPRFSDYLCKLLTLHAEALQKAHPERDSLSSRASMHIRHNLPRVPPTLESLAHEFDMSPRNMRRRLQEEGTSFRDLLESARKEIARSMLQDRSLRMEDIALVLGYSEYSTFSRAFKSWYGVRPSEYSSRRQESPGLLKRVLQTT